MRLKIYTILLYHIPHIKIKGFCDIFTLVLLILYHKKAALVRAAQSIEKILGLCKRSEELLCPKRSTGTFGRINLFGSVKRGGSLVRLPSKCFRISHPLLRFFEIRGISPSAEGDEGLHPSTPPPLKRWTKLLLLSLFVQLFLFCDFFYTLKPHGCVRLLSINIIPVCFPCTLSFPDRCKQ